MGCRSAGQGSLQSRDECRRNTGDFKSTFRSLLVNRRHELHVAPLDLWIDDTDANRHSCELALAALAAEWGATEESWAPVSGLPTGWLAQQDVYCLTSPHGAIDIFRSVDGLDDWQQSFDAGVLEQTAAGVTYRGLSDQDMLRCQLALDVGLQKRERIEALQSAIQREKGSR